MRTYEEALREARFQAVINGGVAMIDGKELYINILPILALQA